LNEHKRRWRSYIFRRWAQSVAFIAGMKISVQGAPPSPPFLLVSNHLSYMDIVALAAHVDCTFVAKSEVGNWPVIGLLCRSMRTIFINRKLRSDIPRALAAIRLALKQGSGIVLFAEGTSTAGAAVAPFKPSLLELAARSRMPVHCASLSYLTPTGAPPAASAVCWWGDMTFPGHLFRLLGLRSFEAELIFGAQPVQAADRKVLSHRLWAAVSAQFSPVAGVR
ncbi:MAG TPA: lysophospholipid acyltransferase family protein, partial [Pyrinomonadaceae bacterium]